MTPRPLVLAVVAGEESGDLLGADLVASLRLHSRREVKLIGVGGTHLQALGLKTMFDPSEIALMGLTAVLKSLPRLVHRIGATARAVAAAKPDCVVLIDSPDFNLRVAKKLRAADPTLPIIQYVCPSVWAWRPERAPAMRAFVDHVLCVLPFEVEALKRLEGPAGTYVGHRLTHDPNVIAARDAQSRRLGRARQDTKTLLVLPGSRRSEVAGLAKVFGETVSVLRARGNDVRVVVPTVPHVGPMVREAVAAWGEAAEIVDTPAEKWKAFGEADAALAASGTVALELALARVPYVSCYKTDALVRLIFDRITVWSGSLPNLIADYPIAPEYFDRFVRPEMLARTLERLMSDSPSRYAQLAGFSDVATTMATDRPSGQIAANVVLSLARG